MIIITQLNISYMTILWPSLMATSGIREKIRTQPQILKSSLIFSSFSFAIIEHLCICHDECLQWCVEGIYHILTDHHVDKESETASECGGVCEPAECSSWCACGVSKVSHRRVVVLVQLHQTMK